jgi:PAS domain S-box-containing protein
MSNTRRALLLAAITGYCLAVFAVDVVTPRGIEVWVLNLPAILATLAFRNRRAVRVAALACTAMVVVGSVVSPPGGSPRVWDAVNRGMGLATIWLIAGMTANTIEKSNRLSAALDGLRREIGEHARTNRAMEQSAERLRLAVEGAGMGTYDVDLRAGTVVCSPTHLHLLGHEAAADREYAVEMWRAWVHPDDRLRVQEARDRAIKDRSLYSTEYRAIRADSGNVVWLSVFGRCYYDAAGAAVRFVGVSFDVTRRKELEREMRRKELERAILEMAERNQRHIGRELHDGVGQELTGLGLMAQTLTQSLPAGGPERRIAGRLVAGIDHLHQQVRDLARGLLPVEIESEGLWAALDDLAARMTARSGVAVTFECPKWVRMPDHATSVELYRIAQEAVSNALRHGKPRTVRLTIHAGANDLRLHIADDGTGLRDRPARTTGMGISIMEYRAESINGVFRIEPADEGGTVVTVALPGGSADDRGERGSAGADQGSDRG